MDSGNISIQKKQNALNDNNRLWYEYFERVINEKYADTWFVIDLVLKVFAAFELYTLL